ncbi:MAG: hypothetical protein H7339_07125 [Arcicella sp.]|nr:hypothetical protein [Arcicella sp.]
MSASRNKGILILGSGDMVHNLRKVAFDKLNITNYGLEWAKEANDILKNISLVEITKHFLIVKNLEKL